MWFKENKWKIIVPALVVIALAVSFFWGGKMPESAKAPASSAQSEPEASGTEPVLPSDILIAGQNLQSEEEPATEAAQADAPDEAQAEDTDEEEPQDALLQGEEPAEAESALPGEAAQTGENAEQPVQTADASASENPAPANESQPAAQPEPEMEINPDTGKDQYLTDPVPEGKPLPVEPQDVVVGNSAFSCTISIACSTVLDNMDLCDEDKLELIPEDGWILQPVRVTFYEGESVFNVLQRVCKQNKIHMEFENTPIYNSAYIEGINNIYEFDVGELSGWMYKVNGWFPNYGCSRYQLKDGDVICWVYTCDLGNDVGGGYATGEQHAK